MHEYRSEQTHDRQLGRENVEVIYSFFIHGAHRIKKQRMAISLFQSCKSFEEIPSTVERQKERSSALVRLTTKKFLIYPK